MKFSEGGGGGAVPPLLWRRPLYDPPTGEATLKSGAKKRGSGKKHRGVSQMVLNRLQLPSGSGDDDAFADTHKEFKMELGKKLKMRKFFIL